MAEPATIDKFNNLNINEVVYKTENEIKKEDNILNDIKDLKTEEFKNNDIKEINNLNQINQYKL